MWLEEGFIDDLSLLFVEKAAISAGQLLNRVSGIANPQAAAAFN
jgi:hypothetical protein